ncbi:MAG: hypothetical protein HY217_01160, partial [Candidatus Rokubacteria bacterium]|nr:hypothetical protein [Candidatus Rokubacteria bacterium]
MGPKRVRITPGLREALEWLTLSRSVLGARVRSELAGNPFLGEEWPLPFPASAPVDTDLILVNWGRRPTVRLNREGVPMLRFSSHGGHGGDPASARRLQRRARWVLVVLKRRAEILERVGQAAVEAQLGYLDGQAEWPIPLAAAAVAKQIGVHPSTVSRVIRQKRLLAPRGVVDLQSLFGRSKAEARQAVRDLLASEAAHGRLTD